MDYPIALPDQYHIDRVDLSVAMRSKAIRDLFIWKNYLIIIGKYSEVIGVPIHNLEFSFTLFDFITLNIT